jgi:hypothetical protein
MYTAVIFIVHLLVVMKTVCWIVLWFTFPYAFRLELATLRVLNREGIMVYISINKVVVKGVVQTCVRCSSLISVYYCN